MIELSEDMPIYATRSLTNYTQYLITKPSGTFEIQYYGTVMYGYSEGYIYVYESSVMKNFNRVLPFPSENIHNFTSSSSYLNLFYVGPSKNNIAIVPRILEY